MNRLSPTEFVESWKEDLEPLVCASPEAFESVRLPADTIDFLTQAGLPKSVAPFLSFDLLASQFVPVSKSWNIDAEFDEYVSIGSNGSGDPVCLVQPTGELVYLHHDDGFKQILINSSIPQFAACSLVLRELVEATIIQNGGDAFLDNDIPVTELSLARHKFVDIDSEAIIPGSFWHGEFERMAAGPW